MILFRGTKSGRVDAKGRLKLPAFVQQRIDEEYGDRHMFITSLEGERVKVFPLREWEAVEARLKEKSTEGKDDDGQVKDKVLFQANRFGSEETLDNQGRILVPAVLRETAGMSGEVKIMWQANHILVFSGDRYERIAEQMKLLPDDFKHTSNLGI